jgi:hypothetical protein
MQQAWRNRRSSVRCWPLLSQITEGGAPIGRDALLGNAAVATHEYPKAREMFADLRSESYIDNRRKRGILLSTNFDDLADVLYYEYQGTCGRSDPGCIITKE